MLHAVLQKIRRITAKFMPGLLLGAVLLGGYFLFDAFKSFGTEKQLRKIRGFRYAEKAMRQIGLSDLADDAADTSLHYETYFRDGDSLTLFFVQKPMREKAFERIKAQNGWTITTLTCREYEQLARQFREPASGVSPHSEVAFDAFFYEDSARTASRVDGQPCWNGLPDCLNLNGKPYTADYRMAFYDLETGLLICYDQTQ